MYHCALVVLLMLWSSCDVVKSRLDIRQPPSIINSSASHVFYRVDQTIELVCLATGSPIPTYEWFKNGKPVNYNVPNIKHHETNLHITGATTLDEGYYQCIVSNQYGKALSNVTYLQRAYQDSSAVPTLNTVEAEEGKPFKVPFIPLKSKPAAQYRWATAVDMVATEQNNQGELHRSRRIQWAENGDLFFAYALPEDSLNGKIYKGLSFNPYVDISSGGSYTKVNVRRVPGGAQDFAPELAFSSPKRTIALEGGNVTLRCFFNGRPDVNIIWEGPNNKLPPMSRLIRSNFDTELKITDLEQNDAGEYTCRGYNSKGSLPHKINLIIQAVPVFKNMLDRPQNINATEGDDVTFWCNAFARPMANIVWMINGEIVQYNSYPRIAISNDLQRLTVRSVCRDCNDRSSLLSHSDLMVIQCNASNDYGHAFASGYLNVLKKTTVSLVGDSKVIIDDNRKQMLKFQCIASSDPSTAVSVKWYISTAHGPMLVYSTPPAVVISDGMLTITAGDNTTSNWPNHAGSYWCNASNGYSYEIARTEIEVKFKGPVEDTQKSAGILDYWWIFIIIACVLLILILILICCICLLRNRGDKYDVDDKERKNGNDPERELIDSGFHDYQRQEIAPFKGSQNSLGSSMRLFDEDASEVGEQTKFLENGSFHSASYTNTADRKRGRSELL